MYFSSEHLWGRWCRLEPSVLRTTQHDCTALLSDAGDALHGGTADQTRALASLAPEAHESPREDARTPAARPRPLECHFPPRGPRSRRDVGGQPRGNLNTCKESPEHLVPGSEGWSRSEGCPQTLPAGFRATWEPARRAPRVRGQARSVSQQGPQCRGAGTEHQPAGPSLSGQARSITSTGCRGLNSWSSGKTEPLAAHVRSCW